MNRNIKYNELNKEKHECKPIYCSNNPSGKKGECDY